MLPLELRKNTKYDCIDDYNKWFWLGKCEWEVQIFRISCETCGSLYCFFNENKTRLSNLILSIFKEKNKINDQRRYKPYRETVSSCGLKRGTGIRMRFGFCFVRLVRGMFPNDEYKGFRYSEYHSNQGVYAYVWDPTDEHTFLL